MPLSSPHLPLPNQPPDPAPDALSNPLAHSPSGALRASALAAVLAALPVSAKPRDAGRCASGADRLDAATGGGLARGRVHEFYAADAHDASAAAGFTAMLAARFAGHVRALSAGLPAEGGRALSAGRPSGQVRPVLWLRAVHAAQRGGVIYAPGWSDIGIDVGAWLFLIADDPAALLRAAIDAVRCAGLGAVVVENWGRWTEMDLTASRRLALAAEKSGVPLLCVRVAADPAPSAADTRWAIAAAPSVPLAANAPGAPAFAVQLLRQRGGPAGLHWLVEWDIDRRQFYDSAAGSAHAPAFGTAGETGSGPAPEPADFGAVVSVSARQSPGGSGTGLLRPAIVRDAA